MRRPYVAVVALAAAASTVAGCSSDKPHASSRAVVTVRTVEVGDPGNPAAAIIPFHPAIYKACSDAPPKSKGCKAVGGVSYEYEIGELEVTVAQYVAFLNTVDPDGTDRHDLYVANMSPTSWPKYGSIRRTVGLRVASGTHYAVAYPEWADKPIAFVNFIRAASFVNALTNGDVLSRTTSQSDGFEIVTYKVRLSPSFATGMYNLDQRSGATRTRSPGFVVPSQNEWIKAAYFDPKGGGTFSYWRYPTGPFKAPNASVLDADGNVVDGDKQPLATYSPDGPKNAPAGTYPVWCPSQAGGDCESANPLHALAGDYQSDYQANVSTVGQTRTRSPWGTLDQAGNAVEWTDTIAPSPQSGDPRVWRYAHGGVANAPEYQLWISATGRQPEANLAFERTYPWQGFRIGVIGKLGPG